MFILHRADIILTSIILMRVVYFTLILAQSEHPSTVLSSACMYFMFNHSICNMTEHHTFNDKWAPTRTRTRFIFANFGKMRACPIFLILGESHQIFNTGEFTLISCCYDTCSTSFLYSQLEISFAPSLLH